MLLERGADVTRRDDRGVSALEFAIREDRQEVVLAILDHAGPEVNAVGPLMAIRWPSDGRGGGAAGGVRV